MKKTFLAVVLAVALVASLAACAGNNNAGTPATEAPAAQTPVVQNTPAQDTPAEADALTGPGSIQYPLDTNVTITYWKGLSGDLIRKEGIDSDNQTKFAENLIKLTGINVDFINPAFDSETEQFNLLLVSGNRPDIIERDWLRRYPAGPDDAIAKGLAYDMTDDMAAWAPDFLHTLQTIDGLEKKLKTDNGRFWCVGAMIRETPLMGVWRGPLVRTDLLEKYGLDKPTTIGEWDTMLRRFQSEGDVEVPLTTNAGTPDGINQLLMYGLFCAWDAYPAIHFNDAGNLVYGPAEPGFKNTLQLLRGWYADGLLDRNAFTNTNTELNAHMGGGTAGSTNGNTGGGIGTWTPPLIDNVPGAKLEAVQYPTVNKGELAKFGQKEANFYDAYIVGVINPDSPNKELAANLLNFGYTPEGYIFYNYGLEGESWNGYHANGYPLMLPEVAGAADNKAEWSFFARSPYNGPMVQAEGYLRQLLVLPTQVEALDIWNVTDMNRYQMPPVTQSEAEGREYSRIWTSIDDYYKEFTAKYILGQVPEDAFENEFVPNVTNMELATVLSLRQAALDRYNSR
jgi:putative aldouronate transport system substrate-binding protein